MLRVDPRAVAMIGIGVAIVAGLIAAFLGSPFLTGIWAFPAGIPLGTPLLFDVGVYLVVAGAVTTLVFALEEDA
jgi:multisubunit Na+/H+ antiporter MnhB subunit